MQNIGVNFRVNGGELESFMQKVQQKGDEIAKDAIDAAIEQTEASKEQLDLINQQIAALDRKAKMELDITRTILTARRDEELQKNRDAYAGRKNDVYSDTGLSEAQMKEKILALDGSEKSSEESIKAEYREQMRILAEQRQEERYQTQIAKEAIQVAKQAAKENVRAILAGDKTLADVYREVGDNPNSEEKLTLRMIHDALGKQTDSKDEEDRGEKSLLGSLAIIENVNKLIAVSGQFAQTKNGFDLIQPASNLAGRIAGGVLGAAVGALFGGVGAVAGANVGALVGGGFGDVFGALEQRQALTKEEFRKSQNRYRSITGGTVIGMPDMSNRGMDATAFMNLTGETARRLGFSSGAGKTAQDMVNLEKGVGVDQATSATLIEIQRSSKANNRDLAELIGGVLTRGQSIFQGDTTFLNEFMQKFGILQKEFLKSQSSVASGTTMDVLTRMNRLGGEFDLRDSRSMANINAIQSALANPGGDNLKAMSFDVLRRMNPGAGIFDILEQRQKGLSAPGYMSGMLDWIDRSGGDDQQKMIQLSGMFPGLSLSAIRRIYNNRGQLSSGALSMDELKNQFPGDFGSMAARNTTDLERNTAEISNGILSGKAIQAMADAFERAVRNSMSGAVIEVANGRITFGARNGNTNAVGQRASAARTASGLNSYGAIFQSLGW